MRSPMMNRYPYLPFFCSIATYEFAGLAYPAYGRSVGFRLRQRSQSTDKLTAAKTRRQQLFHIPVSCQSFTKYNQGFTDDRI